MGRAVRIAAARYGEDSDAVGTLKASTSAAPTRLEFAGFEAMQKAALLPVRPSRATGRPTWFSRKAARLPTSPSSFAPRRSSASSRVFGTCRSIPRSEFPPSPAAVTGSAKVMPKPLTAFNVDKTTLSPLKCANIVVLTEELLRRESYSAETLVRDEMQNALVQLIDTAFIDPANAGTANVKPASIANGAPHSAATGTGDADDVRGSSLADQRVHRGQFSRAARSS
jgi:hypothetical protein